MQQDHQNETHTTILQTKNTAFMGRFKIDNGKFNFRGKNMKVYILNQMDEKSRWKTLGVFSNRENAHRYIDNKLYKNKKARLYIYEIKCWEIKE